MCGSPHSDGCSRDPEPDVKCAKSLIAMKERTKAINKQEQHTTHPSGYCYVSSLNSYRTELAYPDHYLNDNFVFSHYAKSIFTWKNQQLGSTQKHKH